MKNLTNYIKKKLKNLISVGFIGLGSFGLLINGSYGQERISIDSCLNQYYNQFSKNFIKDVEAEEQKNGKVVCQDTLANIFARYIEDLEYIDCSGKINYCNALSVYLIGKNSKTIFIDSENKQDLQRKFNGKIEFKDKTLIFNAKVDYVFGINGGKKYMSNVSQEESLVGIEDYSRSYNFIKKSLIQRSNCW